MLQYNPTVTGSLQVSGDITGTVNGINITGLSQSVSTQLISVQVSTGSSDARLSFIETFTSSALTRLTNIESKSASVDVSISNINSITASNIARLSNLETKSSSVDISISSINSFTSSNANTSLNSKTGSYATTGSNSFYGTQVFSGSVYIANDLVVQGSSSIQYISASSVSIGTNIVQLNTATPSVRFAGLSVQDSGSIGGSGSFLYDSLQDEFVFVHRGNGTNVTSSHFVLGPETYDSLGNETYLTSNIITKGTGKEHLVDSCIFDNGTTTCIKNNLIGTGTISGTTIYGSTAVCSPSIIACTTSAAAITIDGYSKLSFKDRGTEYGTINASRYNFGGESTMMSFQSGNCFLFLNGTNCLMFIGSNGNVGIGTTSPSSPLSICGTFNTTTPLICITGTGTGVYQRVIAAINPGMNAGDDLTIQMGTALCYRNVGQLNYHHEGAGCATNRMSIGLYGVDDVFNVTGNGFVGIGTCTPGTALEISSTAASADRTLPHNVLTITALQGNAPYGPFGGSILFKNSSYVSGVVCSARIRSVIYDDGAPANCGGGLWFETTPTPGGTLTPSLVIDYQGRVGIRCSSPGAQLVVFGACNGDTTLHLQNGSVSGKITFSNNTANAIYGGGWWGYMGYSSATYHLFGQCIVAPNLTVNRGDGNPAVLQLGNTSNSYQIQYTCTGGQRLAFINGAPSEFASFYGTGVSVFTGQTCINGSGAGLQFTGGNNRIYFGACRAIEGNTSGTTLQIGENYDKTQIQSSAMMYNGSNGNSPKLYFGAEGNESAGAKAIYLETFWMVIQPHVNEGLRFRAVNGSGTQYTIAKMYGTGTFSLDQYSNGTLSVSSGIVVSSSDKCMKIDDGGIDTALPKIMCLNPRYFYWKPETCLNSCDRQLGFYAQDVSEVLGTEVANQSHNCSWGIYDRGIIAMLTKGMQEQQCRIKLLESCLGIS